MLQRARPHLNKLLLALTFAAISTSTILWTLKDATPPAWDPADHISQGYDYYRWFIHRDFGGFARDFFSQPHYYAPLVHLITAAVFVVFGASRLAGIGVNLISLAAVLWAASWMARRLYGTEHSNNGQSVRDGDGRPSSLFLPALMAPLLAVCYHFSAWLVHDGFLDYPLTAMTAVTIALLIRAGDFRERRGALLFGAAAGLGMLTKQTFPFFLLLPVGYVAGRVLFSRNRQAIGNLILAGLVAIAVSAVWYGPHLPEVIEIFRANRQAALNENEAPLFSLMSNVVYLHGLVSLQTQAPLGLVFLFGLFHSLLKKRRESLLLYLWLLSGLICFTLVANKDMRYTVPVLPAVALLSVCWMGGERSSAAGRSEVGNERAARSLLTRLLPALRGALIAVIACWSLVSFFNAQWPRSGAGWYIDTPRFRWMVYARNYFGFDHRPLGDDWSVPEIVESVASLGSHAPTSALINRAGDLSGRASLGVGRQPTISPPTRERERSESGAVRPVLGVVVNLPHLNPSCIALSARLMARGRGGPPLIDVEWLVEESATDRIAECDYLLVRTGLDRAEWVSPMERRVESLILASPDRISRVAGFPIPLDQAEAVIYKRER